MSRVWLELRIGPLDQGHRLHGRVEVVPYGLVDEPHVDLAVPIVPGGPAVQDRLVLTLIVGAAEGAFEA
jgi:hypothetical protein